MPTTIFQPDWTSPEYTLSDRPNRGNAVLVVALVTFCCIAVSFILVATDGNFLVTFSFLGAMAVLILTCYRLDWGLYILIGMVLVSDQFGIPGYDTLTRKLRYFSNLKEIYYMPASWDVAVMNPMELHLFLLFFIWFLLLCVRRHNVRLNKVAVWQTASLFFLAVIVALVYGLRRGGDFLTALWEVRALFYFGLFFAFVPQVIQTKEQIHTLFWIIIGAIAIKAFQGFLRLGALGFSFQGRDVLTNHEDPVFILNVVILLFALVVFGARSPQRTFLIWILPLLLSGFFAGQRRAAYAAILPTFLAFVAVLPRQEQRLFLKTITPIAVVLVLYCAIFWNSESKLASPVKLVKTGLSTDREESGDRYYSNLYRDMEKYNLSQTVQRYPVVGVGFGNKYDMPLPLTNNFPLFEYIPHNEVLWLVVKMGAVGFCVFWLFMNSFACRTSQAMARMTDPYLKAVCAVAVAAIVNQVVVSYFDLQMTYYRNMVFLGTLMGLLSSATSINGRQSRQNRNGSGSRNAWEGVRSPGNVEEFQTIPSM